MKMMKNLVQWIFRKASKRLEKPSETTRARQLIAAIDAGGIPLDPKLINRVAQDFGLEVSSKARTSDTIERIRAALERCRE